MSELTLVAIQKLMSEFRVNSGQSPKFLTVNIATYDRLLRMEREYFEQGAFMYRRIEPRLSLDTLYGMKVEIMPEVLDDIAYVTSESLLMRD